MDSGMPAHLTDAHTAQPEESRARGRGWLRIGVPVAVFVTVLSGLYGPIFPAWLGDLWNDPNYSHVFIVPIISGFVIWQRREELAALAPEGSWSGLWLLLAGVGALIMGDIVGSNFVMRSSLVVVLAGLVLLNLGARVLGTLAFPLAFLFFLVPISEIFFYAVTGRLQQLAASHGAAVLDLLGVPILLDGNIIHLSRITLGVTEACSGIRSLITLIALGVAWAYLMLPRWWMRIVLVVSVVPITIAANASRVVMTGLAAQWLGPEYAEGFFHYFSGWLVFVVAIGCLLGVDRLLKAVGTRAAPRIA
jgi:exosortase